MGNVDGQGFINGRTSAHPRGASRYSEDGVFVADQSGSRGVGERFARRLRAKCEYLASLPGTMGCLRSELRKDIRSSAFGSYVILYRYVGNVLEVVTIMGHRDIDAYVEDESAGPSDAD